jgi:hypothetical protein
LQTAFQSPLRFSFSSSSFVTALSHTDRQTDARARLSKGGGDICLAGDLCKHNPPQGVVATSSIYPMPSTCAFHVILISPVLHWKNNPIPDIS